MPALIARAGSDDELYVALRTRAGWRLSDAPVGEGLFWDDLRVLDTSALTRAPSFGVVVTAHDGGSQTGLARTELAIFLEEGGTLAKKDALLIGIFQWAMSRNERRRCRRCAHSFDARPHVEVRLQSATTVRGTLHLTRKVTRLDRLRRVCAAGEIARGGANDDSICPINEIREVQRNAGVWRYSNGHLVR
jgi:hypothetical protein